MKDLLKIYKKNIEVLSDHYEFPRVKKAISRKMLSKIYQNQKEIRDAEPDSEKKTIRNISVVEKLPTDVEFNMPLCIYDS